MAYVRRGLGIKEPAYLGRWKSAVVLSYAEKALETTPANRSLLERSSSSQEHPKGQKQIVVRRAAGDERKVKDKANSLWVKSKGRRAKNPQHLITNAERMGICSKDCTDFLRDGSVFENGKMQEVP